MPQILVGIKKKGTCHVSHFSKSGILEKDISVGQEQ